MLTTVDVSDGRRPTVVHQAPGSGTGGGGLYVVDTDELSDRA